MPRNLFERCEVVFPVRDAAAIARIRDEILPAYLADTVKARLQQADGSYVRAGKVMKDAPAFSSQEFLMQLAEGKIDLDAIPRERKAGSTSAGAQNGSPGQCGGLTSARIELLRYNVETTLSSSASSIFVEADPASNSSR